MPSRLSLPSSLLLLLTAALPAQTSRICTTQANPTLELDRIEARTWEDLLQRHASISRRLRVEQPTAVRKMPDDEGEKFWMDYWYFNDDRHDPRKRDVASYLEDDEMNNNLAALEPAYPIHFERTVPGFSLFGKEFSIPRNLRPGNLFSKRAFQCPANTRPCSSISRPNSCCSLGSVCQIVPDTGLGDVGCCSGGSYGSGKKCSGKLQSCLDGYTNCSEFPGGGCCIPGYICVKDGCLFVSTTTVTITASSSSASTTTKPTTTTQIVNPPIRPTSHPTITTTVLPTSTGIATTTDPEILDDCPTGFYACSAVYYGGCCRTGRDCNPTSCPPFTPYTAINTNGVTIIIPASATGGAAPPRRASKCADGWTTCNADAGGGCCPNGFRCGRESCTFSGTGTAEARATGGGEEVVGKIPPESGAQILLPSLMILVGAMAGPRLISWIAAA
ncbi:hypothetical protein DIZ76_013717 [Coccidioides immitis]|nr:hypothetical protein DIZ76_013717 [Coccidioides immitis]